MKLNEPAITHTPRIDSRSGISYAVNCAALLIPPSKVYLLFEDQPAKNTPSRAIQNIANANRTDSAGFAPYIPLAKGIIPRIIIVEDITR